MLANQFFRKRGTISYFSKTHWPKNVWFILKNIYFSEAFVSILNLLWIENVLLLKFFLIFLKTSLQFVTLVKRRLRLRCFLMIFSKISQKSVLAPQLKCFFLFITKIGLALWSLTKFFPGIAKHPFSYITHHIVTKCLVNLNMSSFIWRSGQICYRRL